MIVNVIDIKDKEIVEKILMENGISFKTYEHPLDAFVAHEIKEGERVYSGTFGEYTNGIIAEEVENVVANEEVGFISDIYNEKVKEYANILDQDTIATAVISNTITLQLKEVKYGCDESFVVVYDNDVYECPIEFSEEHESYIIKIGELEINTDYFIKTNNYNANKHGKF